jgi:predicted nuclease of predicted toxin-antitoxin system
MKLLFDESLSPKLVSLLRDLFPDSESALRNGLAGSGDRGILEYAAAHNLILVSTDRDFERLLGKVPGANVVILRSCNYPTEVALDVLRRNAIRVAELPGSQEQLIILDPWLLAAKPSVAPEAYMAARKDRGANRRTYRKEGALLGVTSLWPFTPSSPGRRPAARRAEERERRRLRGPRCGSCRGPCADPGRSSCGHPGCP